MIPLHVTYPGRLNALLHLNVLDTPAEPALDAIVFDASRLCDTRIALISLVDKDRQWFKARYGIEFCETPIGQSVCALGLGEDKPLVIHDLAHDPRTAKNALVDRNGGIRFYAGAPLVTQAGSIVGMLCVIDTKPRPAGLSDGQIDGLRALADEVMQRLERGLRARADARLAVPPDSRP